MANTHFNSNRFRSALLAVPFSQFYFRQYGAISSIVVVVTEHSLADSYNYAQNKSKTDQQQNTYYIPLCERSEQPKLRKKRFAMERQQTTQKKKYCSFSYVFVYVWCFGCSRSGAAPNSDSICFIRSTTKLDFSEVVVRRSHIRINTSLRSPLYSYPGFLPQTYDVHLGQFSLALTQIELGELASFVFRVCVRRAVYCTTI